MSYKFIYDSIHKHMEMHPIVLNVINTPVFQRLRYLKQLSVTDYVFPTATHTRFEHSIGVSHLAGKMIKSIKNKQPELEIDDNDILKAEIAGLCHDLGHAPFSHTFDKFLDLIGEKSDLRHHEKRSCLLLHYLIKKYKIPINDEMIVDIQDLIHPEGKGNNKLFMYHIISNSSNGIDVDKFDYLKRDTFNLGLPYSIDLELLLETARVIDNEICYPEKMVFSISNIFQTRGRLHKEVYNHPVVQAIELMILEMFMHMPYDWTNIINTPELFLKYTDNIITDLPDTLKFNNAISIRNQIWERNIYKYIDQIILPPKLYPHVNDLIDKFQKLDNIVNGVNGHMKICCLHIGYKENPISKVKFYNFKHNANKSYYLDKEKISPLLPTEYQEKTIRFYIKEKNMESVGKYCVSEFKEFMVQYLNENTK